MDGNARIASTREKMQDEAYASIGKIALDGLMSEWRNTEKRLHDRTIMEGRQDSLKHCIAVQEILRREIVVEAGSVDEACELVQKRYDDEEIVLDSEDLVSMPHGEYIFQADWHTDDEVQEMEATV